MENKAFEQVVSSVGAALEKQGYTRQPQDESESGDRSVLFIGPEMAYGIFYEAKQQRFLLRYCSVEEGIPDEKWRNRSVLLFDPEDEADAARLTDSIIADFTDEVAGQDNAKAALAKLKKTRRKKDDTTDATFFYNRLVNIFPELREQILRERIRYGEIRQVTFARTEVLPRMQALLDPARDETAIKKLCGILCELYENGNFDVRSIITIVLLNNLSDPAYEALKPFFTKELDDAGREARALRGKHIKPEKPPKKKRIVAQSLDGQRMR